MDAPQFDDLVRALVADAAERRSVLRRLLVGAVAGLGGVLPVSMVPAAAPCVKAGKKCKKGADKCCGGAKCKGKCECTGKKWACKGQCIPTTKCCRGGSGCSCPPGLRECQDACIPPLSFPANCCTDDECFGQRCVEGRCTCLSDADCNDGYSCTIETCATDGTCQRTLDNSRCTNDNPCLINPRCLEPRSEVLETERLTGCVRDPLDDGTPLPGPLQIPGDCNVIVCDGFGRQRTEPDNNDLPDDNNPCTENVCTNGVPSNPARPAGAGCPGGVCNGQGTCVPCNQGAACNSGLPGVCATGKIDCSSGGPVCVPNVQPGQRAEVCNGLDDDCDGQVDEGDICSGKEICCAGTCVNPTTDEANCGRCGRRCGARETCCGGECIEVGAACDTRQPGVCAVGTLRCVNSQPTCVRTTDPSPETCNGLDDDCDGEVDEDLPCSGDLICRNGSYRSCPGNKVCRGPSGGAACVCPNNRPDECPGDLCVDLGTDEANCGRCGTSCETNQTCCSGSCKNLQSDGANCGTCGKRCDSGESCCGGQCVNTATASDHCGGCGIKCDPGETCCGGSCAQEGASCTTPLQGICASGTIRCVSGQSICVPGVRPGQREEVCNGLDDDCDGAVDEDLPCDGDLICRDGSYRSCPGDKICRKPTSDPAACVCPSTRPDACSNNRCVDFATDVQHCGGCDDLCTIANGTGECVGGNCHVGTCNAGFADCDRSAATGCETNTDTDVKNCGVCGNDCTESCLLQDPILVADCQNGRCLCI